MDKKMYQSANVTIYFNDKLDDGEVADFVNNALHKYCHPDHVLEDFEYWYENDES